MNTGATEAVDRPLAEGLAWALGRIARQAEAAPEAVLLLTRAARAVCAALAEGHICLPLPEALGDIADLAAARALLRSTGLVGEERDEAVLPLVLDGDDRLYLGRYFDYERRLARALLARAGAGPFPVLPAHRARLAALFPHAPEGEPDRQKLAVALALRNRLTVISGGPGTGKTTTVVQLLDCLLSAEPALRVALAAPTGKAAQRMQEAIRSRAEQLPPELRNLLPAKAHTLHRLLGYHPQRRSFRHHAGNPLPLDVLVVDEASMLDLALAVRLVEAVPPAARLVLLGDKDQLAAVEAGAVYAELSARSAFGEACMRDLTALCGEEAVAGLTPLGETPEPLGDCVIWFQRNYRYGSRSPIGRLAARTNRGDALGARAILREGGEGLQWIEDGGSALGADAAARLWNGYAAYRAAVEAFDGDPQPVFRAYERFRVLCALREGERGAGGLNRWFCARWQQGGARPEAQRWFAGLPVMLLRNDYLLQLYNGDIGIALPDAQGRLAVYFAAAGGGYRALSPARVEPSETAFAMTVHKAQGSEFDAMALVLPAHPSRVCTRELVYTAITRSREAALVVAGADVLGAAIAARSERRGGLCARLAEAGVGRTAVAASQPLAPLPQGGGKTRPTPLLRARATL